MDQPRAEIIVASTLYLISSWVLEPSACACRLQAIVAHLDRMMAMEGLDPVLRATALQLHEHWHRLASKVRAASAQTEQAAEHDAARVWH